MEQVMAYMEQQNMIAAGTHVLVGVSGGGDSVCLLHVLLAYQKRCPFRISVLTVEHGIRGEDSIADMEFVKQLCEKWQVPCYTKRVDVPALVRESGMSEEEAARELRYEALYAKAEELGADKIAVAHHANDRMETMLFFLCRGAGMAGLCPMKPVAGKLIRPLLCVTRKEIDAYLKEQRLSYCTDATNEDVTYARNRIRHQIVPLLETINEAAVKHFEQTAQMVSEAEEVLMREEERAFLQKTRWQEAALLLEDSLSEELLYIQKRVILAGIARVAGKQKDVGSVHVEAVLGLFEKPRGACIDLPYQITAFRDYGGVLLASKVQQNEGDELFEAPVPENGRVVLPDGRVIFTRIIEKNTINSEIPDKTYTKWLDYDIIKNHIKVRRCRDGDFFLLDGAGHKKTIKKYFVDEKVPQQDRRTQWVVADGPHVYLLVGRRLAYDARVTDATRRIMEIRIDKGE